MSVNKAFYVARAAECAADAERTALENVRARCLRAEAAWLAMARHQAANRRSSAAKRVWRVSAT